jgi:K+-sensing histidine kinase KdpD
VNERADEGSVVVAAVGAIVVIVVAALLVGIRDWLGNTNVALLLVGLVVVAAAVAGRLAGVVTALAAAVSFNFFHTQPYRTLRIDDREDIITVVLIVVVGVAVGEVALLGQRERARSRSRATGARDIEDVVGLLAAGAPTEEIWQGIRHALTTELGLRQVTFRPGAPVGQAPTIDRAGRLHPLPTHFARGGFELPPGTCLPVAAAGRDLGCIILNPGAHHGVAPEERRRAVALADVLALALSRSPSIPTLG